MFVFLPKKVSSFALADRQFFCKANYANIIAKFFLAFCVCLCCCKKVSDLAVADMTTQWGPICLVELESLPLALNCRACSDSPARYILQNQPFLFKRIQTGGNQNELYISSFVALRSI